MALQSSWASWSWRCSIQNFFLILSVPFFLSGSSPVPVSNVSVLFFFFPWQRLTSTKIFFFIRIGAQRQEKNVMALTDFCWSQLSLCWFQWELVKSKYKMPGRSSPSLPVGGVNGRFLHTSVCCELILFLMFAMKLSMAGLWRYTGLLPRNGAEDDMA